MHSAEGCGVLRMQTQTNTNRGIEHDNHKQNARFTPTSENTGETMVVHYRKLV